MKPFASLFRSTPPQTGQQDAQGTAATYWSLPPEQLLSALHATASGLNPADVEPDEVQMGMPVEMVTRRLRDFGESGMIVYGYKFRPRLKDQR